MRGTAPVLLVLTFLAAPGISQASNKLAPLAAGTVEFTGVAPVGNTIQSDCHYSRRGVMEFIIPNLPSSIGQATLVLTEGRATSSIEVPPDDHLLSYYEGDPGPARSALSSCLCRPSRSTGGA